MNDGVGVADAYVRTQYTRFDVAPERAPIIVCSAAVAHPLWKVRRLIVLHADAPNAADPEVTADLANAATRVWRAHNVGTVVNVAREIDPEPEDEALFREQRVRYVRVPLDDETSLETCGLRALATDETSWHAALRALYAEHMATEGAERAFVVACLAGANRSAFVAALLLWHESPRPRRWPSPVRLVEHMCREQRKQRGPQAYMLVNGHLVAFLIDALRD